MLYSISMIMVKKKMRDFCNGPVKASWLVILVTPEFVA